MRKHMIDGIEVDFTAEEEAEADIKKANFEAQKVVKEKAEQFQTTDALMVSSRFIEDLYLALSETQKDKIATSQEGMPVGRKISEVVAQRNGLRNP